MHCMYIEKLTSPLENLMSVNFAWHPSFPTATRFTVEKLCVTFTHKHHQLIVYRRGQQAVANILIDKLCGDYLRRGTTHRVARL